MLYEFMFVNQRCLLQESCARILLYRGANKDTKNNSGQTPFQVMAECLAG